MAKFSQYRGSNNCPSCQSNKGSCKTNGILILCMGDAINPPLGYRFTKRSSNGLWNVYAPGEDHPDAQTRETWRRQQEAIRLKREEQKSKQTRALPLEQRHELYSQLFAELRQTNSLHPDDRADLHKRGLTDDQIQEWGVVSVCRGQKLKNTYPTELAGIGRDGRSLQAAGDGYMYPIRNEDGLIVGSQIRLRGIQEGGKYRWLAGEGRQHLPNGENPLAVFLKPNQQVYLVEGTGPKPLIASDRLKASVVGAAGGQFGSSSKQLKKLCKGRSVILVPDGGAVKNKQVMGQYAKVAKQYPDLQVLWWEQVEKGSTDIDEITPETLEQAKLISWADFTAISTNYGGMLKEKILQFAPRNLSLLKRQPDFEIGDDEFKKYVEEYPQTGITALWGAQGSGKGEAIARMINGRAWGSVTTLRSLARSQAEDWGGVFANEGDTYNGQLLKEGQPVSGGSVCLPSLLKWKGYRPKVLILDEWPKIQDMLTSSKLCNKDGIRPLLLEEMARLIREADQVIVASADLREEGLRWVEQIRGEKAFLIHSSRKPLPWTANILAGTKREAIAEFIEHLERCGEGKLCVFHSDSKRLANQISATLEAKGIKNLLINSDTSGGEIQSLFMSSKGDYLPCLVGVGYKAVITTPSIKEGLSIQRNTELIDSVWGIFEGCSITPDDVSQTLNRVRSLANRYLWIAERGRACSQFSFAETISGFLRDLRRTSAAKVALVKHSLKTETLSTIENIDWHDQNLRLLAEGEVRRNQGMKAFRAEVLAALQHEGKIIQERKCSIAPEKAIELAEQMAFLRSQLDVQHATAVANTYKISEAEAQELKGKPALTPQERLCLERYCLEKFYRTEIAFEDVLWDKGGEKRRRIRNLEAVLNPEKVEQRSVSSIEINATTPQDWEVTRLQLEILERSGCAALIRAIWAGDVIELEPETIKSIGEYFKNQAEAFSLAFKFRDPDREAISETQLVGYCLDWCGLKRDPKPRKPRQEGKQIRVHAIDQDNLAKLKTIVERRSQPEAPPQDSMVNEGGASGVDPAWLEPGALEDARQSLASAPVLESRKLILQYIPPEIRPLIGAA